MPSSSLTGHCLLESPDLLRDRLIREWKSNVECEIIKKSRISLDGELLDYVKSFDFARIKHKPLHEIIEEHRKTTRHAPRFGGGLLIPRPLDPVPPSGFESHEQRYIEQLIEAYHNHKGEPVTLKTLASYAEYHRHFSRSRERYFCAEAIRLAVRDSLPAGVTFEQTQDRVHDTVIDTADDSDHASGFVRVKAVTNRAADCRLEGDPIRNYMKEKALMGVCHQLANANRLIWVKK